MPTTLLTVHDLRMLLSQPDFGGPVISPLEDRDIKHSNDIGPKCGGELRGSDSVHSQHLHNIAAAISHLPEQDDASQRASG